MRPRLPVVSEIRLRPWADITSKELARTGSAHVRATESLLPDSFFHLEPIGFRATTENATVGSPVQPFFLPNKHSHYFSNGA